MDARQFLIQHPDSGIRDRNTAAANEAKDIQAIILAINTRTPAGVKICAAFQDRFGVEITAARARTGSSRGTHYDFEVEVAGVWRKIEHKGGKAYRLPSLDDAPWKAGVQFHNGGCEKYSLARKYARIWYDIHIQSGSLVEEFGISAAIPGFDEWFENDCRVQADPRTLFGKELKQKVRRARGSTASLREKRAAVLDALDIGEEDKATLIAEVLPIANHALGQKEYWLSIHGSLAGDFHAVWYPSFTIETIQEVRLKKKLDVEIEFVCADNFVFKGILRWGKGAGFSCLRVDLK